MGSVYLRSLELSDMDRTHRWHNDPDMYKTLIGTFHYVGRETEAEWLRQKQAFLSNEINLAICLSDEGQHIGNIYLRNIDWVSRHAELHIFIGEAEYRSRGYGREAVHRLVDYAFKELGLNRLHLLVLAYNQAAIRLYEKTGFIIEGRLRKHVFKGGEFKDVLFMGLCSDDVSGGYS